MLFLRRPTADTIQAFLAAQAGHAVTYLAGCATATTPPAGYVVDHTHIRLGNGEKVFASAKTALERWQQFHLGWLEACPEDTSIFGFAYSTLPDHVGSGAERFLVEWDREEGSVWYDILAFSRPRHFLAKLGYPWMRRIQKRFGRESAAVMRQAVGGPSNNAC
jgi:uncharacterized protein (UPF0548 family)